MMLLVLSDTHARRFEDLPEIVLRKIKKSDLVVHAGDFDTYEFYSELRRSTSLKAVAGNSDDYGIIQELPETLTFDIEGFSIGVTHMPIFDDFSDLVYKAKELEVDIMIFGHTHRPFLKEIGGIVLLNPGSPTEPRYSPPSFAEIIVDDVAEIVVKGVGDEDIARFRLSRRKDGSR